MRARTCPAPRDTHTPQDCNAKRARTHACMHARTHQPKLVSLPTTLNSGPPSCLSPPSLPSSANSTTQKMYNWNTMNQKVFKRLGFNVAKQDLEAVSNCQVR